MNVIVLWADSKSPNLGCQMLAEGIETFLRIHTNVSDIQFISHDELKEFLCMRIFSLRRLHQIRKDLKRFDLVIDMGDGDSFTIDYGKKRFLKLCAIRVFFSLNAKKIILGPQTIGSFSGINRIVARISLYGVSAVAVRDSESLKALSRIYGGTSIIATDISWCMKKEIAQRKSKKCLINLNGLYFSLQEPEKLKIFQKTLQNLALVLAKRKYTFDFMHHVTGNVGIDNDQLWETHIISEFPTSRIFSPSKFQDARRILKDYEFSVGTRYHFCLNSLQAGTPCIPISYGKKFDSVYQNLANRKDFGEEILIEDWEVMIDRFCNLDLKENDQIQSNLIEEFAKFYKGFIVSI